MKTTNFTENHNTYSGIIDIEDFSTEIPNKKRINKYQKANDLASECEKLKKSKKKKEKLMQYTLEELKEMKLISNTNGRPSLGMTDEKWQQEFEIYRFLAKPSKKRKMQGKFSKESGTWNEENGEYKGMTNWQQYCAYINDVLDTIRANQHDYCYFIYQIQDLLKYETDKLRTKYYEDGYWEVWLDA